MCSLLEHRAFGTAKKRAFRGRRLALLPERIPFLSDRIDPARLHSRKAARPFVTIRRHLLRLQNIPVGFLFLNGSSRLRCESYSLKWVRSKNAG
jgi:hypothetical protein